MDIESMIIIGIALALPIYTEWRMKRMLKKMLNDPKTAHALALMFLSAWDEVKSISAERRREREKGRADT